MNQQAQTHQPKRWIITPPHAQAADLAGRLRMSPVIAQILLNRGIGAAEECSRFLQPSLKGLHDPFLLPNLRKAAERINRAIADKEKIVIYGDYDVDGITATTILWHAIRLLGGVVDWYIPHRIDEGYGLNAAAISEIIDNGAKLILTVDCGVTALEPAKVAKERGVDLMITDHHEWKEKTGDECGMMNDELKSNSTPHASLPTPHSPLLPDCFTVVHPRLVVDDAGGACHYPNHAICGAGVAFKLAWGVGVVAAGGRPRVSPAFRDFLVDATALAALGTIADVVPLVGENRILAAFGLGGLKASKLVGIRALIESASLTGQTLDSYDVGFRLAPRLNACGRMGHAREAVEMLTSADFSRAVAIATELERKNRERQAMERQIVEAAAQQVIDQNLNDDDCHAIVLGGEGWHPGVIGIVASRIVEKFCRPTIIVAFNKNGDGQLIGQGSGRSIPGFHLAKALDACGEYLESHGGHEMAAGLKVRAEKFDAFRQAFCKYAFEHIVPEQLVPELKLDALTQLADVTAALVGDLRRLGPFGNGNRRPVFVSRNLEIAGPPKRVGKTGNHLQLFLRQGRTNMKAIAFGFGTDELMDRLKPGVTIDLAFEPTLNEFNGFTNVQLEVKDLQFCGI